MRDREKWCQKGHGESLPSTWVQWDQGVNICQWNSGAHSNSHPLWHSLFHSPTFTSSPTRFLIALWTWALTATLQPSSPCSSGAVTVGGLDCGLEDMGILGVYPWQKFSGPSLSAVLLFARNQCWCSWLWLSQPWRDLYHLNPVRSWLMQRCLYLQLCCCNMNPGTRDSVSG